MTYSLGRYPKDPVVEPAVGSVVVNTLVFCPLLQVHEIILAATDTCTWA